jgi:hypothetical protein
MIYERLKKGLVSLIISAMVVLSAGFASNAVVSAQRYDRDGTDPETETTCGEFDVSIASTG